MPQHPPRSTLFPYTTLFRSGGTMVTSRETFGRIFPGADADRVSIGLLKLEPKASSQAVLREVNKKLWPEAVALRRARSEEHTSELQSQSKLVCRLLLEQKRK